jgi:hypothetical protein
MMADETKTIEVLRCQYRSSCRVRGCAANATVILHGPDSIGRPTKQWEICQAHSEQVILREAQKGRAVVRLWAGLN